MLQSRCDTGPLTSECRSRVVWQRNIVEMPYARRNRGFPERLQTGFFLSLSPCLCLLVPALQMKNEGAILSENAF